MIAVELPVARPAPPLAPVQDAVRRGDRRTAYRLCVQLTAAEPRNAQAWLWRAGVCESLDERIAALTTVLALDPHHAVARSALHQAMNQLLRQDAFLAYVAESDDTYTVRTAAAREFVHPKDRAVPQPFPHATPPPARLAFRWLAWTLLGLIPAGIGALVCAPLAMLHAARLLRSRPSVADRTRAHIVLWLAGNLWLLAVLFFQLFLMHL